MKKLATVFVFVLAGCAAKTATPAETVSAVETAETATGPECVVPGTNRCIDYGACSLQADLRGASGETLEMYDRELKENNSTYSELAFPHFEAKSLENARVSSQALEGPTVFVLLAGHCSHSFDSVPVMNAAVEKYGDRINIIGVVVNSGSPEDVAAWVPGVNAKFDIWVHPETEIGDQLGSHLVPSWFFVDDGKLERKLVGFQDTVAVDPALTDLTS